MSNPAFDHILTYSQPQFTHTYISAWYSRRETTAVNVRFETKYLFYTFLVIEK